MISYIFKSKIKNFFVIIFSAIFIYINLQPLYYSLILSDWLNLAEKTINTLPYVLIFVYMVTLKRDYKIKPLLFPIAFAVLIFTTALSLGEIFDQYTFKYALTVSFIGYGVRMLKLIGYIFCFIGSISNFKRINFLRYGLAICIITIFILGYFYRFTVPFTNPFFSYLLFLDNTSTTNILLLFYISVFALTLTKKGEYIDISPYIEARKLKKEIKKARKAEKENEVFTPPVVPEGSWRCMGCGKILPDDKSECECGYKR